MSSNKKCHVTMSGVNIWAVMKGMLFIGFNLFGAIMKGLSLGVS